MSDVDGDEPTGEFALVQGLSTAADLGPFGAKRRKKPVTFRTATRTVFQPRSQSSESNDLESAQTVALPVFPEEPAPSDVQVNSASSGQ